MQEQRDSRPSCREWWRGTPSDGLPSTAFANETYGIAKLVRELFVQIVLLPMARFAQMMPTVYQVHAPCVPLAALAVRPYREAIGYLVELVDALMYVAPCYVLSS